MPTRAIHKGSLRTFHAQFTQPISENPNSSILPSVFVNIEVGQRLVIDDPDGEFSVTAFDANHCPENRVMPLYLEEVRYPKLWSLVDTVLELHPLSSLETYHKKKKEEAETKFARNLNSENFEQNEKVRGHVNGMKTLPHSAAITTVDWHPSLPIQNKPLEDYYLQQKKLSTFKRPVHLKNLARSLGSITSSGYERHLFLKNLAI